MKYERIDPAEMQALNDEIAHLKAEAASAEIKRQEAESAAEAQATRVCIHIFFVLHSNIDFLATRCRGQLTVPQRGACEK